ELISRYTNEEIKIKWPNDLFINDRKAGGILIENVIQGQLWQWCIIGIGINIIQDKFQENIERATSLKQTTGKSYNPVNLAKELHSIVLSKIAELQEGRYKKMLTEYNTRLFGRHKRVKLKKGSIVFETLIEEVSPSGELITNGAIGQAFKFDEVEWIF
ncbi:MAG: biotin--[acetyl-CoA-carboxylase] ligase, partial [Ginsengibacter sp.]